MVWRGARIALSNENTNKELLNFVHCAVPPVQFFSANFNMVSRSGPSLFMMFCVFRQAWRSEQRGLCERGVFSPLRTDGAVLARSRKYLLWTGAPSQRRYMMSAKTCWEMGCPGYMAGRSIIPFALVDVVLMRYFFKANPTPNFGAAFTGADRRSPVSGADVLYACAPQQQTNTGPSSMQNKVFPQGRIGATSPKIKVKTINRTRQNQIGAFSKGTSSFSPF